MNKSTEKLVAALREAGLNELADKAATEYFHDYESELDTPCIALVDAIKAAGKHKALIDRVIDGEFDATYEEGEAWARSEEGRAAFTRVGMKPLKKDAGPTGCG